jgi:peroxiredoxin
MANLHIGDKLIDFTLPATDGNTYRASDVLKMAKALIVTFTCNHCPYAQAWEGRLIQLIHDYDPQGVHMLAISSNDATKFPSDDFEHMTKRAIEKH